MAYIYLNYIPGKTIEQSFGLVTVHTLTYGLSERYKKKILDKAFKLGANYVINIKIAIYDSVVLHMERL